MIIFIHLLVVSLKHLMVQKEDRFFFSSGYTQNKNDLLKSISFRFPQLGSFIIDPKMFLSKILRRNESTGVLGRVEGFISVPLLKHFGQLQLQDSNFFILSMKYKNLDTLYEYENFYFYSYKIVDYKFIFESGLPDTLFNYTHKVLAEFNYFFIHKCSDIPFKSLYDYVSNEKHLKTKKLTFLTNKEQLLFVLRQLNDLSLNISPSPGSEDAKLVTNRMIDIINNTFNDQIQFLRLVDKNTLGLYKISMIIMDLFKIFGEVIDADFIKKMSTCFFLFPPDPNKLLLKHKFTIGKYMTFLIIEDVPLTDIKIYFYNGDEECDFNIGYTIFQNYIMFDYNDLRPYLGYHLKIEIGNEYKSRLIKLI